MNILKVSLITLALLIAGCGAARHSPTPATNSLFVADRPEAAALAAPASPPIQEDSQPTADPAPDVQPTIVPRVTATPRPAPVPTVASGPGQNPPPTPLPNPQTFLRVTVEGAPALNCYNSLAGLDCEDPRTYAMATFHLGDRLPYTRILTDVRGKQFYILGPWTPVGLMPVADAVPMA